MSVRGQGLWLLIPIENPLHLKGYHSALTIFFKKALGIKIDSTKGYGVNEIRGYSYDPNPYINHNADLFKRTSSDTIKPTKLFNRFNSAPSSVNQHFSSEAEQQRVRVEYCAGEVYRRGLYLGDSYTEWFAVGVDLANTFGEVGREYFRLISYNYPDAHNDDPDEQFTHCLTWNKKAPSLGTFFKCCGKVGVYYKGSVTAPPIHSPGKIVQKPKSISPGHPTTPNPVAYPAEWDDHTGTPGLHLVDSPNKELYGFPEGVKLYKLSNRPQPILEQTITEPLLVESSKNLVTKAPLRHAVEDDFLPFDLIVA